MMMHLDPGADTLNNNIRDSLNNCYLKLSNYNSEWIGEYDIWVNRRCGSFILSTLTNEVSEVLHLSSTSSTNIPEKEVLASFADEIDDVDMGEHTEAEEINHALMAISSSNEMKVSKKETIAEKWVFLEQTLQNLWKLIDSGMSSNSKVGLGFEIKSNNEVLSFEEEMNFSIFKCSKEDSIGKHFTTVYLQDQ
ncbi:hypothetical protein Tco_0280426 [Tanacetum coccineum]